MWRRLCTSHQSSAISESIANLTAFRSIFHFGNDVELRIEKFSCQLSLASVATRRTCQNSLIRACVLSVNCAFRYESVCLFRKMRMQFEIDFCMWFVRCF